MSDNPPESRRVTALDLKLVQQGLKSFWFHVWLVTVAIALTIHYVAVSQFAKRQSIVVMDPSKTLYVASVQDLNTSKDFHSAQTSMAMAALFDRDPNGPDHEQRMRLLFTKPALAKASAVHRDQQQEFQSKELHQKVEVGAIEIMHVRDQTVRVAAVGQLIRTGVFRGRPFNEVLNVVVQFTFIRNSHMVHNGRFPTVVSDFELQS